MPDYRKVAVEELPDAPNPTRHKREVDEAVGASTFGFNVYVAEPGELVPWGRHRHPDHEELFYVIEGALAVETPDGEYAVRAGEAFFVPEDAPNEARTRRSSRRRVRAVAKSPDGRGISTARRFLSCGACGTETRRFGPGPDG